MRANAGYSATGFQIAEMAIYQAERIITQPLVREGKTLLVAGYPIDVRQEVEHQLTAHCQTIKATLDGTAGEVRKLVQRLQRRRFGKRLDPSVPEFVGGVIRGLVGL